MPHPDAEHGLQIQLATALRQLDEEKAMAGRLGDRAWAAEAERDSLRVEVKRLREALTTALSHGGHFIAGDGKTHGVGDLWRLAPEHCPCAALAGGGDRG